MRKRGVFVLNIIYKCYNFNMIKIGTIIMTIGIGILLANNFGIFNSPISFGTLFFFLFFGVALFIIGLIKSIFEKGVSLENNNKSHHNWILVGVVITSIACLVLWELFHIWD